MDKSVIESFSINARVKLRRSIDNAMAGLGIGPGRSIESMQSVGNITVLILPGGIRRELSSNENIWRQQLIDHVDETGYDQVVEEVAYTWFNRLISIRYMEVNDYLPTHVRVLSSLDPEKVEPDMVSQCLSVDYHLSEREYEEISKLFMNNELDKVFNKMFIYQCRELNKILPELFTITKPYENMLLNISYINPDGVVRELVDHISEEDFKDAVQIIGWMYQYYNTELKDSVNVSYNNNKLKISKDEIPAVTQLFTPDWIVRYMVENSVGRIWQDGHSDEQLKSKWTYYIDEVKQESVIETELKKIRNERSKMLPSEITVLDPCMGSGHILVYAFDVLMQIYRSYGYLDSEAVELILTKNLYGLDIDDRAYQLAYFAVMMKARQYDSFIFEKKISPNLFSIPESNVIDDEIIEPYLRNSECDYLKTSFKIKNFINYFIDGKKYGSLLKPKPFDWELIEQFVSSNFTSLYVNRDIIGLIRKMYFVLQILNRNFDVVITNPPYLGFGKMESKLCSFIKTNYEDSKSDLCTCFIERCNLFLKEDGYLSMITQNSYMFLKSYQNLRLKLSNYTIFSMVHLGPHAFDAIGGEVVQTTSWISTKQSLRDYIATYIRLTEFDNSLEKALNFDNKSLHFYCKISRYDLLPLNSWSYWVPNEVFELFSLKRLEDVAEFKEGLTTANNNLFLRRWFEVNYNKICFAIDSPHSECFWIPYNKGGNYRKWYGNRDYIINWTDNGKVIKNYPGSSFRNSNYQTLEGGTFSAMGNNFSVRYSPAGAAFDSKGTMFFSEYELKPIIAYMNSSLFSDLVSYVCPTLDFRFGTIQQLPFVKTNVSIDGLISASKCDWDMMEISWDFQTHPLINGESKIKIAFEKYKKDCQDRFNYVKEAEETINRDLINRYNLSKILDYHVSDEKITIRRPDVHFSIMTLILYSVGCMFGRYSLDVPGLYFAGGSEYHDPVNSRFKADADNVIPINENECFGDDIVTRFVEFIKVAFGEEHLEENLKFIAESLEIKGSGTPRELIRKYFLNDFYKDHLKMYSNLPIYWLFDSGKENGFKALIYLHRYDEDLITRMRQNYLLPLQRSYSEMLKTENDPIIRSKLEKKINEVKVYDLAMEKFSFDKVSLDLDDGIKVNYAKFQNIENPGTKGKINLLYKLK